MAIAQETIHLLIVSATVVEQPQLPFAAMLAATDKNILVVQVSSAAIQRARIPSCEFRIHLTARTIISYKTIYMEKLQ